MTIKSITDKFANGTRTGCQVEDTPIFWNGTTPGKATLCVFSDCITISPQPDPNIDTDGDPTTVYTVRTEDIGSQHIKVIKTKGSAWYRLSKTEPYFLLTKDTLDKVYEEISWYQLTTLPPVIRRRGQKHLAYLINTKLSGYSHNNWFLSKPVIQDGATFIVVQSQGMWATVHGVIGTDRAGLDLEDLDLVHLVNLCRELSFTLDEVLKDLPLPPLNRG